MLEQWLNNLSNLIFRLSAFQELLLTQHSYEMSLRESLNSEVLKLSFYLLYSLSHVDVFV